MDLLPLHKHEDLLQACIDILNKQWPRSNGARLHSLSKSCDNLPVALAFCVNMHGCEISVHKDVIGFSKISDVQGRKNSCLFESVIVREEDRGKGFGKALMELTEEYAKRLGIKTAYLSTTDKVGFYTRLGYIKCKPVISLGANASRVPESMLKQFLPDVDDSAEDLREDVEKLQISTPDKNARQLSNDTSTLESTQANSKAESSEEVSVDPFTNDVRTDPESKESTSSPPLPSPPPPPPLQSIGNTPSITRLDSTLVTWMKKEL